MIHYSLAVSAQSAQSSDTHLSGNGNNHKSLIHDKLRNKVSNYRKKLLDNINAGAEEEAMTAS